MLPGPLERDGSIGCGTLILLALWRGEGGQYRGWLGREGGKGMVGEGRGWLGGDGWWEGRRDSGKGGGKRWRKEGTPYLVLTQRSSTLRRVASNRHVSVT